MTEHDITVTITELRTYKIRGAKTDAEAIELATQRADQGSPLDLIDQVRTVTNASVAPDGASV